MFHREILEEVSRRFDERRRAEEAAAEARCREVEEQNPALRNIGRRLRSLGMRVLEASMKGADNLPAVLESIAKEHRRLQEEYENALVAMGKTRDYTKPRVRCALCRDSGAVNGKMCVCMKKEVVREGMNKSGIAKLLDRQRFDNFDLSLYSDTLLTDKRYSARDVMRDIYNYCRDYAENFSLSSPSLLFIGGTGLGKTHLSSAIAGKVIEKGYDVVYVSAPQIASTFEKERFEADPEKSARFFDAELLILDDLGTEPPSKAVSGAIYRLINDRVSVAGKPTIISSNLSYQKLEQQYDSAVLSRLLGEFEVKLFQGADIRRQKLQ